MKTIKVSSIAIETRDFTNEETGEISNNFALIFDNPVPGIKKNQDGEFVQTEVTSIVKPASHIAAMLYNGCAELKKVRSLKGESLTATQFAAYLEGATAEITATEMKAGAVDGDYTWQHDGYKYEVKVTLAQDIRDDIAAISREIRRKALGL